jgi:hypothetical protein
MLSSEPFNRNPMNACLIVRSKSLELPRIVTALLMLIFLHSAGKTLHVLRVLNFLCIIWGVLTVELTLSWNSVSGVTRINSLGSVGQQLPTMIGAFSLIRSLWLICEEKYDVRLTEVLRN